jgi:hypothetical protein
MQLAFHGIAGAIRQEHMDYHEDRVVKSEHEEAFVRALGHVARTVGREDERINPRSPSHPTVRKSAADSLGDSIHRERGTLPPSARPREISHADYIDPRDNEPVLPETRRERSIERFFEKSIRRSRDARDLQKANRSMIGTSGTHRPMLTRYHRMRAKRRATNEFKEGTISAFELQQRKRDTKSLDHRTTTHHMGETERKIRHAGRDLAGTLRASERHAVKKQERSAKKSASLGNKISRHQAKIATLRSRL